MKVRARKGALTMSDNEISRASKRRRKQSWQSKKQVAAALMTSSCRKHRIDSASLCMVAPNIVRVTSARVQTVLAPESRLDYVLELSTLDRESADRKDDGIVIEAGFERLQESGDVNVGKVVDEELATAVEETIAQSAHAAAAPRLSILESIFSPVFSIFKSHVGEASSSCHSSERPETSFEMLENSWKSDCYQDINNAACTTNSVLAPYVHGKSSPTASLFNDELAMCLKHAINTDSMSLVDVGEECIEWDSIQDKSCGVDDRPFPDHVEGEDDMMASDFDVFFSLEHGKVLECNDEGSSEVEDIDSHINCSSHIIYQVANEEDDEKFDEIEPYLFINRLPSLSEVVSPCRPLLLPRQTRRSPPITLVLDLDETLVHSTLEHCEDADFSFPVHVDLQERMVYVRRRPHLQAFMERVAQLFEIIVFTASQSVYAEQLLNVLDPKRKLIRHRIFRDSCVYVRGYYLKDLTILGRDLSKVAIVDNSPQAYGFQVDNGIPIESWFSDRSDCALTGLLPFLETLVGVDDVRPIIAKRFNLRQKVAAAADMVLSYHS